MKMESRDKIIKFNLLREKVDEIGHLWLRWLANKTGPCHEGFEHPNRREIHHRRDVRWSEIENIEIESREIGTLIGY